VLTSVGLETDRSETSFARIYRYFNRKSHPVVIDVTVGEAYSWKTLWSEVDKRTGKTIKEGMEFHGLDNRKTSATTKIHDITTPLPFPDACSDLVYFDPPFYTREDDEEYEAGKLVKEEVFTTEKILNGMIENLKTEVPRVLKPNGVFIVKIMDSYVGNFYTPTHFVFEKAFSQTMRYAASFAVGTDLKRRTYLLYNNFVFFLVFKNDRRTV
jgi:SAM-dependent methyltransferase